MSVGAQKKAIGREGTGIGWSANLWPLWATRTWRDTAGEFRKPVTPALDLSQFVSGQEVSRPLT